MRYLLLIILLFPLQLYSQTLINSRTSSGLALTPASKEKEKDEAADSDLNAVPFDLGTATFSTEDKKIELNYYGYFVSPKFTHFFVGLSGGGSAKNSIASILSNKNVVGEGNANLRLGFRLCHNETAWDTLLSGISDPQVVQYVMDNYTSAASDLWLVFGAELLGSSFKLYHPDSVFASQVQKKNFTGRDVNIGLNYWSARKLGSTVLAGATIGVKRTNNFDDLVESTRTDTKTATDTTGETRDITIEETVYQGKYEEKTVYPLNFDLYFVPHKLQNCGFLIYSSTSISKVTLPATKLGIGMFFLRKQNAFNPVAGVTFEYSDIFNNDQTDDHKGQLNKFKVALTTRINIVNRQRK